ncbi:MAG: hypothetical protein H0V55_09495, partial [Thermoleophilaceae bacterium]|nr:hypothetical protein [Thermoleophilaceae bacterium]
MKLLDAPHAGTGSCSHATAGPTRRGRRALLALGTCVLAVALGAAWVMTDGEKTPALFEGGLFAHSLAAAVLIALLASVPGSHASRLAG